MPSADWFPYPEVIFNVMNQIVPDWYELIFNLDSIVSWCLVHKARNYITRKFLSWWYDYLWFVDDDNPPSCDVLKLLIEANKDVCTALIPLRHPNYALNVIEDNKNITSINHRDTIFEVDNFWTWCVLLSRDIVNDVSKETMWLPYQFRTVDFVLNQKDEVKEIYTYQDKVEWWKDIYHNDWTNIIKSRWEVSEDLWFWHIAKQFWYKFYAHKNARCRHYKRVPDFLSVLNQ